MKNDLYVHGDPKPRKRFFVLDERIDGEGDSFGMSFFNKEDAIAEAEREWRYLTAREKRDRRIFVGYIDDDSIPDDVLGERSIIGDIDPEDWDEDADENWFSGFSMFEIVFECMEDEE